MSKCKKITLWVHEESEMASLQDGKKVLHFGNYWDFHAGCYGTEITFSDGTTIDFYKEWTDDIRSPMDVAEMVAKKIGANIVVKKRKTQFDC